MSASFVLRTMRDFPGDNSRPEHALGTIIGWLDTWDTKKSEKAVAIHLHADTVEHALVVIFRIRFRRCQVRRSSRSRIFSAQASAGGAFAKASPSWNMAFN